MYEDLLTPTYTTTEQKGTQFCLNPAILRVNKQVCEEATGILYERSGVIRLEIDPVIVQQMDNLGTVGCCHHFPEHYPIRELTGQNLWSEPMMKITFTRNRPVCFLPALKWDGYQGLTQTFVDFKKMLPRFFRFMTVLPTILLYVADTRITVEVKTTPGLHQDDFEALLHHACGFGVADIQNSQSIPIQIELASKMTSTVQDFGTVLKGVSHHEAQIKKHADAGRTH